MKELVTCLKLRLSLILSKSVNIVVARYGLATHKISPSIHNASWSKYNSYLVVAGHTRCANEIFLTKNKI